MYIVLKNNDKTVYKSYKIVKCFLSLKVFEDVFIKNIKFMLYHYILGGPNKIS